MSFLRLVLASFLVFSLSFSLNAAADLISDPVVNPTALEFTATFQAATADPATEAFKGQWTVNGGAGGTYPFSLPATATSASRTFEVKNDDVICFEISAEAAGNQSGTWQECATVIGLPGAPGVPENVTLVFQ